MKYNIKNIIAFVVVMAVMISVVVIPVRAEAGISEAVREYAHGASFRQYRSRQRNNQRDIDAHRGS